LGAVASKARRQFLVHIGSKGRESAGPEYRKEGRGSACAPHKFLA
jgi:hypothetical protein